MRIEIGNVYSVLRDLDLRSKTEKKIFDQVVKACTVEFKYTGRISYGSRSYPVERKIPKRYFSYLTHEFPTGWAGTVARKFGLPVQDLRVSPAQFDIDPEAPFKLRKYQRMAVKACVLATRGVVAHPTGSGKSVIIAELIRRLKVRTLLVVPKLDLLTRAHGELSEVFDGVGVVGEGTFEPGYWITVATPQTLWRRRKSTEVRKLLRETECLIFDECHHINVREVALGYKWVKGPEGAGRTQVKSFDVNTWWQIANSATSAYWRFGFTATPGEQGSPERRMLESMTGRVIHSVSSKALSEAGYLAAPRVKMYQIRHAYYSSWQDSVKYNIVQNDRRNKLLQKIIHAELDENRRVLVVVDRVEHGKRLWKMIDGAEFVSGSTPGKVRDRVLKKLRLGGCVIGTVFDEGSNVPELDTVVIASAGRSPRRLLQRIGRVMRPALGKEARIIDLLDEDGRSGRPGILWRQSYSRMQVYYKNEYPVKVLELQSDQPRFGVLGRKKA